MISFFLRSILEKCATLYVSMSFCYLKSLLSFELEDTELTHIIYHCFQEVFEEQVDDDIVNQFIVSQYDAELLLSMIHERISAEYRKYKNNCLRQGFSSEECNAYNDDLYTTDYELLCDNIRNMYSEICYYLFKIKIEEQVYNNFAKFTI